MKKYYRVDGPEIGCYLLIVPDGVELPAKYVDIATPIDLPQGFGEEDTWNFKVDTSGPWVPVDVCDVLAVQATNNLRALQSDEPEPEDAWLVESGVLRELMAQVAA